MMSSENGTLISPEPQQPQPQPQECVQQGEVIERRVVDDAISKELQEDNHNGLQKQENEDDMQQQQEQQQEQQPEEKSEENIANTESVSEKEPSGTQNSNGGDGNVDDPNRNEKPPAAVLIEHNDGEKQKAIDPHDDAKDSKNTVTVNDDTIVVVEKTSEYAQPANDAVPSSSSEIPRDLGSNNNNNHVTKDENNNNNNNNNVYAKTDSFQDGEEYLYTTEKDGSAASVGKFQSFDDEEEKIRDGAVMMVVDHSHRRENEQDDENPKKLSSSSQQQQQTSFANNPETAPQNFNGAGHFGVLVTGNSAVAADPSVSDATKSTIVLPTDGLLHNDNNNSATIAKQDKIAATTGEEEQAEEEGQSFVNEGFRRWEEARRAWLGLDNNASATTTTTTNNNNYGRVRPSSRSAVPLDVDEIIDIIFLSSSTAAAATASAGTHNNNNQDPTPPPPSSPRFPKNVALPQMVDILQDLWEAEGLDA